MSRFFKNAAFPILIVVVLAFFAQRLISPGEEKPKPNYGQFLTQVANGDVKSVTINTRDNTLDVSAGPDGKRGTRPATRTTPSPSS
jgi:cell division protease FtsH